MAAGEVVGGILLTGDQLLRVEELAVGTRADLIDHGRLQVDLRNSKQRRIAYPLSEKHTRESHRTGERTVSENKMLPRMSSGLALKKYLSYQIRQLSEK